MRIEVVGDGTISQQARTYAEYRVFAALTQFSDADKVQRVRVLLRPVKLGSGCEGIACTVTVALEGSDSFRIRTDRAPCICRNQPRGRTHQSQRGDRNGGPRLWLRPVSMLFAAIEPARPQIVLTLPANECRLLSD